MPTPSAKSPKPTARPPAAAATIEDRPFLMEPGSEVEPVVVDEAMAAPVEKLPTRPFSFKAQVRKHPALYIGLGVLAVAGLAAFFGRDTLVRKARPIVVRRVRPILIRAAASHPLRAARLAARHPRAAARLVAGLR